MSEPFRVVIGIGIECDEMSEGLRDRFERLQPELSKLSIDAEETHIADVADVLESLLAIARRARASGKVEGCED